MIRIQNIYYMLSYAFQVLNEQGYKSIATEEFHNVAQLCAAILAKGIARQIKRGLGKEYQPKTENLTSLHGKINLSDSIKTQTMLKKQMVCVYDDFSVNSYMNQIIKSTVVLLLHANIPNFRKKELRKEMVYFREVHTLELSSINWKVYYNRNNHTYQMLISICYLVVKGLLQTNSDGTTKLMDFLDEQRMCRLYEKFILEYYRRHFPWLTVTAAQIPWSQEEGSSSLLPIMQSDIQLQYGNTVLIIDAKYYSHTTHVHYDKHILHSDNVFQIFTYVKNRHYSFGATPHTVSGMILYAKTEERIQPDDEFKIHGNWFSVKTLDLNLPFSEIAAQMNEIIKQYFR